MPLIPIALEVVSTGAEPDAAAIAMLSEAELAYCAGHLRFAEHVAARVAAKRAISRILGPAAQAGWSEIELIRTAAGPVHVRLSRRLDEWRAEQLGIPVPWVSMTHAGGRAAAIAWLASGRAAG